MPRRRFRAKDAITPLDQVQVQLKDTTLGQHALDHESDEGLLPLANDGFFARKKKVLGQLLADGRTARHHTALAQVLFQRVLHPLPVEPLMFEELRILGGDDGALEMRRDPRVINPLLTQAGLGVVL